jgi:hypothetical protein
MAMAVGAVFRHLLPVQPFEETLVIQAFQER